MAEAEGRLIWSAVGWWIGRQTMSCARNDVPAGNDMLAARICSVGIAASPFCDTFRKANAAPAVERAKTVMTIGFARMCFLTHSQNWKEWGHDRPHGNRNTIRNGGMTSS